MDGSQAVKGGVALVAILAAGLLLGKYYVGGETSGEDGGAVTHWICHNEDCGGTFTLTINEAAKQAREADDTSGIMECPKCDTRQSAPAELCPHCSEPFETLGHGMVPEKCPSCDEPLR